MNVMAIRIDQIGNAVRLVERLAALTTPDEEFAARDDKDYEDADEMLADISDDRLLDEYSLFVAFIQEAKEVMAI